MIVGLILARGGSKSIKDKNLVELGGKSLIAWTWIMSSVIIKR